MNCIRRRNSHERLRVPGLDVGQHGLAVVDEVQVVLDVTPAATARAPASSARAPAR
jgi:erythromycin esterase-like protein